MRTAKRIKCAACSKHNPDHEPEILLTDVESGRQRYYHNRCGGAALQLAMSKPAVYVLSNRYVSGVLN